jgi:hypothetical protein
MKELYRGGGDAHLDGSSAVGVGDHPRREGQLMAGAVLAGHAREIEYLGTHEKFANTPPEGVRARCKCGWIGADRDRLYKATADYREHKAAEFAAGVRICTACGERRPMSEMGRSARHLCRACITSKTRAWADANPAQYERARRNSHLLKTFGLTVDEWDAMFAAQGGVCAICKEPPTDPRGYAMHTDHDHSTGEVRGILCHSCNNGLGNFRDRSELLIRAAEYLSAQRIEAAVG